MKEQTLKLTNCPDVLMLMKIENENGSNEMEKQHIV